MDKSPCSLKEIATQFLHLLHTIHRRSLSPAGQWEARVGVTSPPFPRYGREGERGGERERERVRGWGGWKYKSDCTHLTGKRRGRSHNTPEREREKSKSYKSTNYCFQLNIFIFILLAAWLVVESKKFFWSRPDLGARDTMGTRHQWALGMDCCDTLELGLVNNTSSLITTNLWKIRKLNEIKKNKHNYRAVNQVLDKEKKETKPNDCISVDIILLSR